MNLLFGGLNACSRNDKYKPADFAGGKPASPNRFLSRCSSSTASIRGLLYLSQTISTMNRYHAACFGGSDSPVHSPIITLRGLPERERKGRSRSKPILGTFNPDIHIGPLLIPTPEMRPCESMRPSLRIEIENARREGVVQSGEEGHGLGLANTRTRLEKLYGEQGSMTVSSAQNSRFLVSIEFPLTTAGSIAS